MAIEDFSTLNPLQSDNRVLSTAIEKNLCMIIGELLNIPLGLILITILDIGWKLGELQIVIQK